MTWLVWRQHRNQALLAAAALAALAILLLITGLQMRSQYSSALSSCGATHSCGSLAVNLKLGDAAVDVLVLLTMAVPALLGLFWGAPSVASEIENGTGWFTWMQSVTRGRWFGVMTAWLLLAAAAWGGAIAAIVTWWSGPMNALKQSRFNAGTFDIQAIAPIGYALFAVALGLAAGVLLRRTLPALALTVAVFTGVRLVITAFLREHYMAAVTTVHSLTSHRLPTGSFLQVTQGAITPDGLHVPADGLYGMTLAQAKATCPSVFGGLGRGSGFVNSNAVASCLSAHGYRGYITYQPASRFWAFQGIETGIFVFLAAALVAVAAFVLLRRDA